MTRHKEFAAVSGHHMKEIVDAVKILFDELIQKSNQYKDLPCSAPTRK